MKEFSGIFIGCQKIYPSRTSSKPSQGKKEEALQKYRGVYDSYTKLLGPRHHDTVEIKHIIGHVLLQKGNVVEALVVFQVRPGFFQWWFNVV